MRAWHETYGLPVVLTNCSNNYGPYHFPEKLIPVIILNALADKPRSTETALTCVIGSLSRITPTLLLVMAQGAVGRSYNIGGENERTNLTLVQALCSILDELRPKASSSYTTRSPLCRPARP